MRAESEARLRIALVTVAALLVALGAAAIAIGRRRGLASGRLMRILHLGRLSARLSTSWLGARLRRLFASRAHRARIDSARRAADARRIAETMGHMKGALMKLGQMISFISDDIPEEYRAALASLQAAAPPMDFALLRDVAEHELGRPLERAFARFDDRPLASASIGQVHRAQLPTGEEVVVKIQYPGVAEAIRGDLDNFDLLYRMGAMAFPGLDPRPVVAEVRARVLEELDYRQEARNQRLFGAFFDGHPFIRVPRVVEAYSTARLLTSEYVPARRFSDVLADGQPARDRWGEIIYRFVTASVHRFGVFNGDPHPGNYLFDGDGRVVFLDFGCVKYFPAEMLRDWQALVLAYLAGDRAQFRALLVKLGFIAADAAVTDDALAEFFGYFYAPFAEDRPFTFTREYNARSLRIVFRPEGQLVPLSKAINLPPDFVVVNRFQWGVYSVLAQLGATANFHRIQREVWGGPPSTELGHLDHEHRMRWLERRGLPREAPHAPEALRRAVER